MGDEPLLPLVTDKHRRIAKTTPSKSVKGVQHRRQETVAEIWPETSFRKELIRLLAALNRRYAKQGFHARLQLTDNTPCFLLTDSQQRTVAQFNLEQARLLLQSPSGRAGQFFDEQC